MPVGPKLIFGVSYYETKTRAPNVDVNSLDDQRLIYWKCLTGSLASAVIFGGQDVVPILFSASTPPTPQISRLFESLEIGVKEIPFSYSPPAGFSTGFLGAFYLLDVIKWAADNLPSEDVLLLCDPDCLVRANLANVGRTIRQCGISSYTLWYAEDHSINGLSRRSLLDWLNENVSPDFTALPNWFGGEYLGLTRDGAKLLSEAVEKVWKANLRCLSEGRGYLRTEEQVISAAMALGNLRYHDAGGVFVARIWTAGQLQNASKRILTLPIWHLPSEKTRGFQSFFALLDAQSGRPLSPATMNRGHDLATMFNLRKSYVRQLYFVFYHFGGLLRQVILGEIPDFEKSS